MNSEFPRIITLLRKERGLSQKQAALELGISQALLSHYEKGIRECGLDFVIHIADYYKVSCDYLLGRTPDRQGATLHVDDLPDLQNKQDEELTKENSLVTLNKKLIMNSVNIVYELLNRTNCKGLTTEVSSYLMVAVYKMLRTIYSSNPKNPQAMFSVAEELYPGLSSALASVIETNATLLSTGKAAGGFQGADVLSSPVLSPEILSNDYPDTAPSLYNLVRNTEDKLKKLL